MSEAFVDVDEAKKNRERIEKEREKEPIDARSVLKDVVIRNRQINGMKEEYKMVPEQKKKGGNMHQKHRDIESHKAEIIADFIKLGSVAMLEKWGISASGWCTIKKKWAADIVAAGGSIVPAVPVPKPKVNKDSPELSIDWQQEYIELASYTRGYRQAVLDVFGQKSIDITGPKG